MTHLWIFLLLLISNFIELWPKEIFNIFLFSKFCLDVFFLTWHVVFLVEKFTLLDEYMWCTAVESNVLDFWLPQSSLNSSKTNVFPLIFLLSNLLLREDYWSFQQLLNHWLWGSQWKNVLENLAERARIDHCGTCYIIKVPTPPMPFLLLAISRCLRNNNLLCDPFCGYMLCIYLHCVTMAFELETSLI